VVRRTHYWIAVAVPLVAWAAGTSSRLFPTADAQCLPAPRVAAEQASADVAAEPGPAPRRVIRITADPNNLPFTNDRLEGFENKIADLIAHELGAGIEYTWRAQRRGFFRTALKEGEADLVLGVPTGFDIALTTAPYYRSTYVFVTRKDRHLAIESLDDPALKKLKVGVQLVGNDGINTPPAHGLARRGVIENVVGYTLYGDYSEPNPPARIVEGVASGDTDMAVVWGPLAGYFAKRQAVELALSPVRPENDPPGLRYAFNISMGVRREDKGFRDELNGVLERKRPEVERILDEYGVPRLPIVRKK
jgi:mxaJ protein